MADYIWLIPAFPALGFLINGFLGNRISKSFAAWIACLAIFLSFLTSVAIICEFLQMPPTARIFEMDIYNWIASGEFSVPIGFRIDALSVIMCLVVTGVGFLIHVYSIGYMHGDPGFRRFFIYMNLFVFMMLLLVTGNNLLLMFVGWEGVGLCSYLLIGFWYEKDSASNAGKKAFIVNRVGDFGFLMGIFLLFATLGAQGVWTLKFGEIQQNAHLLNGHLVAIITLLFFVGAVGKSAQIPLYVWLPDAMEGPTPVSSLIHAATMVTAGVYMIARLNFLYSMAPATMFVVAIIGVLTAFFAASIGFAQYDIKRVLAYSTISQLGFMFVAMGVGAYAAGIFHLMTHAFFKGLLFLGAGSVMHAMSGELDMRNMGGLRKKTPVTYWTFFIACLAIAGIPGFSGFFSKDEILWKAFSSSQGHMLIWLLAAVTAGMTAFYMFRLFFGTFHGECRASEEVKHHIHESPRVMTIPLMILAFLSLVGGYVGIPHILGGGNCIEQFLAPVFGPTTHLASTGSFDIISAAWASAGAAGHDGSLELALMVLSVIIALIGISIAYVFYVKNPALPQRFTAKCARLYHVVHNKYFVDELYDLIFVRGTLKAGGFLLKAVDDGMIEGLVNGTAATMKRAGDKLRRIETGYVQEYAIGIILGAIVVVGYLIVAPMF
ncbi:MAG: NADH-quinone oxidoreductase subunit L [Syntrophobacteraceae bacterium CG23_combo_of_CG06-09_8_20_14_all_50_8]|nr:MAG: NADH-quinone oxidoreductase subunit L [Syntrophobacteraceae bacterium CG23_combo_of_CG06-09_8_20_14_all_50_8]